MLMFIALAGVIIMAIIVNLRLSKIKKLEQPEPEQEQEQMVEEVEPTKPDTIEEKPEPVYRLEPETDYEPQVDAIPPSQYELDSEIEEKSEETRELQSSVDFEIEQVTKDKTEEIEEEQVEIPPELRLEPEKQYFTMEEPSREASSPFFEKGSEEKVEETVDLEMPFYFEISSDVEEEPEEAIPEEPQTEEEWYVPEEPAEDSKKEEDDDGIVVCPHCSSEVPKTIYCIYCGNSLKPNPLVEEP
jgi:type IV secretory pathway VirB10-like protein